VNESGIIDGDMFNYSDSGGEDHSSDSLDDEDDARDGYEDSIEDADDMDVDSYNAQTTNLLPEVTRSGRNVRHMLSEDAMVQCSCI
jgi:hypothetical protein